MEIYEANFFIDQVFIKHLLCDTHCSRCWGFKLVVIVLTIFLFWISFSRQFFTVGQVCFKVRVILLPQPLMYWHYRHV